MTARLRVVPGLVLVLAAAACERSLDPSESAGALRLNLQRFGRVELELAEPLLEPRARQALERWAHIDGYDARLTTGAERGSGARVVVGGPDSPLVQRLVRPLGIELAPAGFRFAGHEYGYAREFLVATYEDPDRPNFPLTLVLGGERSVLDYALESLVPGWRPQARVYRGEELVLDVPVAIDGTPVPELATQRQPRWRILESQYHRVPGRPDAVVIASNQLAYRRVRTYLDRVFEARARAADWARPSKPAPLRIVLESHVDGFQAYDAPAELARSHPFGGTVSALLAEGLPDDGGRAACAALLVSTLGRPAERWLLDGASVDAADSWWGRDLEEWCATLALGEPGIAAHELVDASALLHHSPHIVYPLRGLLFRFLRKRDPVALRSRWAGEAAADTDLDRAFAGFLSAVTTVRRNAALERRAERQSATAGLAALRGAALSYPFGRPDYGYGTRACAESLDDLVRVGANAVAVTSFQAALPGPGEGWAIRPRPRIASLEGDVAVAAAIGAAHERGLVTLLAPNLLSTPSGSWSGDLKRTTTKSWREFFTDYERFVVHYALLAELAGADVLSLGSGMPEATRTVWTEPESEHPVATGYRAVKQDGWAAMIREARQAFAGALTYGCSGGAQAEEIDFWDGLDFVGLELYPFLGGLEDGPATDRAIRTRIVRSIEQVAERATLVGKPVLVTEAGFRSTERAWRGRWDTAGPVDLDLQAQLVRVLERAFVRLLGSAAMPAGVFVWSWSTDPSQGASQDRSYALKGKPAELELRRLFRVGREDEDR